MIQYKYNKWL